MGGAGVMGGRGGGRHTGSSVVVTEFGAIQMRTLLNSTCTGDDDREVHGTRMSIVPVSCSVLQCVVVCCSELQYTRVC